MPHLDPDAAPGRMPNQDPPPDSAADPGWSDTTGLDRASWWNWFLLAGVSIVAVSGLATSMRPLIEEHVTHVWPWAKTELVLLVGISILMLVFVAYLTNQQSHVSRMRQQLVEARRKVQQHTERNYRRLLAASNVRHIMSVDKNLQLVLDFITNMCAEHFDADWSSLMLHEPDTDELVVRSTSSDSGMPDIMAKRRKVGDGISGWVARERQSLVLGPDYDPGLAQILAAGNGTVSASMVVPIVFEDDLVGVLNVSSRSTTMRYTAADLETLDAYAANVGACIRDAEHIKQLRDNLEKARAALNESRDSTAGTEGDRETHSPETTGTP